VKVTICGTAVDNVTMAEAVERIAGLVAAGEPSFVVTPNVDHIVRLQHDDGFRRAYADASLVLADGSPLLWASRVLGSPLAERVTGSDLFPELCRRAAERSWSVYFFGGRPGAAEEAGVRMRARFPGLAVAGTDCPPLGFERDPAVDAACVRRIREARPDILFVGLGAPKQEKWIHAHRADLGVPVSVGIGVTFDFVAGMVRRAPLWLQRAGLEWLWRLLMEPGKLWRRYLIDDTRFFRLVLAQRRGAGVSRIDAGRRDR
jgi:N-acetylglucosaminyldiphosphoundecaprenol N-acetyl-beta-D-mannosaminyltransferase